MLHMIVEPIMCQKVKKKKKTQFSKTLCIITKSLPTNKVMDYQAFRMTHILHLGATSFETEQMSEMQRPRASEIRQNPVLALI